MSDPINNGGPAFPLYLPENEGNIRDGMSLRDWFAGQALRAIASRNTDRFFLEDAEEAYRFADAMLAAREAKP